MVLDAKVMRLLEYEFELQDVGTLRPEIRTSTPVPRDVIKQLNKTLLAVSLSSPEPPQNRRVLQQMGVAVASLSNTHPRWEVSADGVSG